MLLQRVFHDGDALVGLTILPQRLRLQPNQPEVVGMLGERRLRDLHGARIFLRSDMRFDQIPAHRRILRRQAARLLERGDRLAIVAELLVSEPEVRQQEADVDRSVGGFAARLGHHRPDLVDEGLIAVSLLEGFRKGVVPPRAALVQVDDAARVGLGRSQVAEPPCRL